MRTPHGTRSAFSIALASLAGLTFSPGAHAAPRPTLQLAQAPTPPRRPNPAAAPLSTAPAPAWLRELPSAEAVLAAFPSPNEQYDLIARSFAAFSVFIDYLDVRSGVAYQGLVWATLESRLPPAVREVRHSYVGKGGTAPGLLSSESLALFVSPAFRIEVLSRFLPRESVALYEKTRNGLANAPGPSRPGDFQRVAEEREQPNVFAKRKKALAAAGVSTSVFGIELYAPLDLPACDGPGGVTLHDAVARLDGRGGDGAPSAVTCRRTGTMRMAHALAKVNNATLPRNIDYVAVKLAQSSCPDWVAGGCTVSVGTIDGYAGSVAFETTRQAGAANVEHLLAKKYGRPTGETPATCTNGVGAQIGVVTHRGTTKTWRLADRQRSEEISVAFVPIDGLDCDQGWVEVETSTLHKALNQAEARHQDSQPAM